MCSHHWQIDTPNGEMSTGRCGKCGQIKVFRNWLWYHDNEFEGYGRQKMVGNRLAE